MLKKENVEKTQQQICVRLFFFSLYLTQNVHWRLNVHEVEAVRCVSECAYSEGE